MATLAGSRAAGVGGELGGALGRVYTQSSEVEGAIAAELRAGADVVGCIAAEAIEIRFIVKLEVDNGGGIDVDVATRTAEGIGDDIAVLIWETDDEGTIDGDISPVAGVLIVACGGRDETVMP